MTAVVLAATGPAAAQVAFSDQSTAAGLNHTTALPFDMSQRQMFSGGSVGDFNRDGWPDIFLLGGGDLSTPDALFLNNGDGTFTDHAAAWGVNKIHRGRGTTVGDFNNDGWPDIYITSGGDMFDGDRIGQHMLYRNNGNGSFTDIAVSAGVNQTSFFNLTATGAAFGDYDLDGDLDLFVTGWEGVDSSHLYLNNGNETFTDTTGIAGVGGQYYGFSPRFVDMNGDRYPELLIAADFETSRYFVNDQDGTFTNYTVLSGTGLEKNGMGHTVADFNRDGLPDWYVTSIYADTTNQDGNYMYINQGDDTYTVVPEADGARDGGWGWGTDAIDFDHDGWVDLVETNGWMPTEWLTENSYLYRNNGDLTFSEVQGPASGFDHVSQGRSAVLLDYDKDGDMDILLTGWDEPVKLFRNDVSGPNTNWLEIMLDTSANPALAPDGYGAKVTATAGGVTQHYWVSGGTTYLGRSQMVAHFGLGAATVADVTVEWSDGTTSSLAGVAVNQILTSSPEIAGAPGEASDPGTQETTMTAGFNRFTEEVDVTYTPSCDASNHTIYYGDLADVSTYGYAGAACWRGNSGATSFDPAGLPNAFFLVVGNTGAVEGSYGLDGEGSERPEATAAGACELPRDLSATCATP